MQTSSRVRNTLAALLAERVRVRSAPRAPFYENVSSRALQAQFPASFCAGERVASVAVCQAQAQLRFRNVMFKTLARSSPVCRNTLLYDVEWSLIAVIEFSSRFG
jgi:hypothetical protein